MSKGILRIIGFLVRFRLVGGSNSGWISAAGAAWGKKPPCRPPHDFFYTFANTQKQIIRAAALSPPPLLDGAHEMGYLDACDILILHIFGLQTSELT